MRENNSNGRKYDTGKLRYDLIPVEVLEALASTLTYGAQKYEPNNWQKLDNGIERYYAAAFRHLMQWRKGEQLDQESGLSHLSHCLTNISFILYLEANKTSQDYRRDELI